MYICIYMYIYVYWLGTQSFMLVATQQSSAEYN